MTYSAIPLTSSTTQQTNEGASLPVAIIGAGPIGLAAAAHLQERKIPFIIIEKGLVASAVTSWQHVRLFSPWKYNIDAAAQRLLTQTDWQQPNEEKLPTGQELVEKYLGPLAKLFKDYVYVKHEVIAISRQQTDRMKTTNRQQMPFEIITKTENNIKTFMAAAVIDATGTWGNPNPALSNGLFLPAERALHEKIDYSIPDITAHKERYINKKIAVIGGGHSAINSLIQLVALKKRYPDTQITWVLRKDKVEQAFGGGRDDQLVSRGQLGLRIAKIIEEQLVTVITPFRIQSIEELQHKIHIKSYDAQRIEVDQMIVNTGNRPNFTINHELRFEVDAITEAVPALSNLIDPNLHSCGSVDAHGEKELRQLEKNFYIVGSKSYGRAPTFLMATGYEQVRSIAAYLAGDMKAAQQVQLSLPETGVCSSDQGGCC
ncbi:FAD-dependent oxidoreductase [Kurthia sibirica]|uniref:Flavoprotein n=1 Tax=Kurthia sibirica TaxID=202750 RepID=A0A2U3AN43_9BACL|nr:FAD-dependent oxidoreductase [Kurthia sibirica]PWI25936.1 flavoprotein [Kurthia sibirica]GEK35140.1 flavoprotein [Kurthia sibirica]